MKKMMISLFNNSEILVQIPLEFSRQIVEGWQFHYKRPFQLTKICDLNQLFGCVLRLCTKCDRSIVCKNLDGTVV